MRKVAELGESVAGDTSSMTPITDRARVGEAESLLLKSSLSRMDGVQASGSIGRGAMVLAWV